jgi:phage terminase large subunit-like protein
VLYENDSSKLPEIEQTVSPLTWRARVHQPGQYPPKGDWRTWYIRGGRGGGKTWTGAHQLSEWIKLYDRPEAEWGIVAPTFGDARDTCVEGPSGLLKALGLTKSYKGWNRSYGELNLLSGGVLYCDGADDGAYRIQGKNLLGLWADEVGLWKRWKDAWDESIAFAVRIDPAKIIATGTPKRGHPLVKRLMADETVAHTVVRTLANAENLSKGALDELISRYAGTELGRQELEGDILADVPGALVKRDQIQYGKPPQRYDKAGELVDDYQRIVVAIDPAGTYGPDSDETGIMVCGAREELGFVIDDLSGRFSPNVWANRAIQAYTDLKADAIVAETNYGGDMVEATLRSAGFTGRFIKVVASRGKLVRAEPITGKYEQGLIYHTRPFPELEDQLCTYVPPEPGKTASDSPDRLDALVWAFTELMLEPSYSGDQFSMIA